MKITQRYSQYPVNPNNSENSDSDKGAIFAISCESGFRQKVKLMFRASTSELRTPKSELKASMSELRTSKLKQKASKSELKGWKM